MLDRKRTMIAGRGLEFALGVFFIVAAALKALDMEAFAVQVSMYGVVKDPSLVKMAAYSSVILETILGAAFLAGIRLRGLSFAAAGALTFVFSLLIAYAWRYKGLEDCGCFGEYLSMTPPQSLSKNAVLLAFLAAAWYCTRPALQGGDASGQPRHPAGSKLVPVASGAVGLVAVMAAGLVGMSGETRPVSDSVQPVVEDASRPFQKFQFSADGERFNLGEGEYLVAFLSPTCEHCQSWVEGLNEFAGLEGAPTLVSLLFGEEDELEEFQAITNPVFPTPLVKPLDFFEFVEIPPRLIYLRDGREVRHWDDELPAPEELLEAVRTDA